MEKTNVAGGVPAKHERACWVPRTPGPGEAVLMIDIEQLAVIQRQHGVGATDSVGRLVTQQLKQALRGEDRLACLRAHEFMLVLRGTTSPVLMSVEARIRRALHQVRVAVHGEVWSLSCLLGGAACTHRMSALEELVRAADQALWQAQRDHRAGRLIS